MVLIQNLIWRDSGVPVLNRCRRVHETQKVLNLNWMTEHHFNLVCFVREDSKIKTSFFVYLLFCRQSNIFFPLFLDCLLLPRVPLHSLVSCSSLFVSAYALLVDLLAFSLPGFVLAPFLPAHCDRLCSGLWRTPSLRMTLGIEDFIVKPLAIDIVWSKLRGYSLNHKPPQILNGGIKIHG